MRSTRHAVFSVVLVALFCGLAFAQQDDAGCWLATTCEACQRLAANGTECGFLSSYSAGGVLTQACVPGNEAGPFNSTYNATQPNGYEYGFCCADLNCTACTERIEQCGYSFSTHACARRSPGVTLASSCDDPTVPNLLLNKCQPSYPSLLRVNLTAGETAFVFVEVAALVCELTVGDQGPQRESVVLNATQCDLSAEHSTFTNSPSQTNVTSHYASALASDQASRALNITLTCLTSVCEVDLRIYCTPVDVRIFAYLLYGGLTLCGLAGCVALCGSICSRNRRAAARRTNHDTDPAPATETPFYVSLLSTTPTAKPPAPAPSKSPLKRSARGSAKAPAATTPAPVPERRPMLIKFEEVDSTAFIFTPPGHVAALRKGQNKARRKSGGSHEDSDAATEAVHELELWVGIQIINEDGPPYILPPEASEDARPPPPSSITRVASTTSTTTTTTSRRGDRGRRTRASSSGGSERTARASGRTSPSLSEDSQI